MTKDERELLSLGLSHGKKANFTAIVLLAERTWHLQCFSQTSLILLFIFIINRHHYNNKVAFLSHHYWKKRENCYKMLENIHIYIYIFIFISQVTFC